ncbi:MAG: P-loop NTPase [Desulfobacterales bacterium]
MKIIISGKGGSGKSTISTLIARALANRGYRVLLVDADESNYGLQRLLGVSSPVHLMDHFGGKKHFKQNWMGTASNGLFRNNTAIDAIPEECLSRTNGVYLMVVGKIHAHGEGCACPMGILSKSVLSKLDVKDNEIVIVDTEAGVEHFGRRVDGECDLILGIVDPSFESFMLAKKMRDMAEAAGCEFHVMLNKSSQAVEAAMAKHIPVEDVIAKIPQSDAVFMDSLQGNPLSAGFEEIDAVCDLIEKRKKEPRQKPLFI